MSKLQDYLKFRYDFVMENQKMIQWNIDSYLEEAKQLEIKGEELLEKIDVNFEYFSPQPVDSTFSRTEAAKMKLRRAELMQKVAALEEKKKEYERELALIQAAVSEQEGAEGTTLPSNITAQLRSISQSMVHNPRGAKRKLDALLTKLVE